MSSDALFKLALSDPYCVAPGDTLSKIAAKSGRSVADLRRLNAIKHPDRLEIGQTLYLSEASAFGATVLFLDALRHPIENLRYRLEFDGCVKRGTTGADGLIPKFVTDNARSQIKVWVQSADGVWERAAQVASDYGHKLVTLTSNAVVVASKTKELAAEAVQDLQASLQKAFQPHVGAQPQAPAPATGASCKNNPAVKSKAAKGTKGQPIVKIEVDIPQGLLDLFGKYSGQEISEADWAKVAGALGCEAEVLKAFSVVESGGKSSFWRLNHADGAYIPALLFERHYFSRLTKGKFDASHPDISWPTAYRKKNRLGKEDKAMQDGKVEPTDIYSDSASAYLRLINAYRLDADAALRSCSWGKFQIMGDNASACGEESVRSLVSKMCTSEYLQINLMAAFIQKKPAPWKDAKNKRLGRAMSLLEAIRSKDWSQIAYNYNGPTYKTYQYDTRLKAAYEKFKQGKA